MACECNFRNQGWIQKLEGLGINKWKRWSLVHTTSAINREGMKSGQLINHNNWQNTQGNKHSQARCTLAIGIHGYALTHSHTHIHIHYTKTHMSTHTQPAHVCRHSIYSHICTISQSCKQSHNSETKLAFFWNWNRAESCSTLNYATLPSQTMPPDGVHVTLTHWMCILELIGYRRHTVEQCRLSKCVT